MDSISASKARAKFHDLIDETASTHVPVTIVGKHNNAVLVAAEDWTAIQETLFLLSVTGMSESIREGLEMPLENCDTSLPYD